MLQTYSKIWVFMISKDKRVITPQTHTIEYLWFMINFMEMKVIMTMEKCNKIAHIMQDVLRVSHPISDTGGQSLGKTDSNFSCKPMDTTVHQTVGN